MPNPKDNNGPAGQSEEHERPQAMLELMLYKIGSTIGAKPAVCYGFGFTVLVFFGVAGWLQVGHPNNALTDTDFKLLWSNSESEIATEVGRFLDKHGQDNAHARAKPWYQPAHYTMSVARGDQRGQDIADAKHLDELFILYKRFRQINVTTKSGLTYSTDDICHRGGLPDTEGGPIFPCFTSDNFQCFAEYLEALHPSYVELDPLLVDIPELAGNYPLGYSARPKWRESTPAEIKKEISTLSPFTGLRGCSSWTQLATWTWKYWGGGVEWNEDNTEIVLVGGIAWVMFYDGYQRATYRMSLTHPEKAIPEEVEEAIDLHKGVWSDMVWSFNNNEAKLTENSNLKPNFVQDIEDKSEEIPWLLLISGAVAMNFFVFFTNFRFGDHRYSRASFAGNGLFCVLMTTVGGSGLILLLGYRFNASMLGALPLLSLGLGLDDMFVIVRYFMTFKLEQVIERPMYETCGKVLEEGGPGVFLTSMVNSISFGMGALLPIPGLATFCIGACIASALNLFTIILLFLPYMCLEINRIKECRREFPCQAVIMEHSQAPPYQSGWEDVFVNWLGKTASVNIMKPQYRYGLLFVFTAYFIGMVVSIITLKSAGYTPKQIAPHNTIEYLGLEHLFDFFGIFPAWMVYFDLDVPDYQPEMLHFMWKMVNTPYCQIHPIPPYLTMFGLFHPHLLDNSTYTQPNYAPGGVVNAGSYEEWYKAFNAWRHFPLEDPNKAFLPEHGGYPFADLVFTNEFTYHKAGPELGGTTLEHSFNPFFITNLNTDEDFIEMIRTVRECTADTEANAIGREKQYPYSDMLTFWSVFLDIEPIMYRALAINFTILLVLCTILLKSVFVAIVSTLTCIMVVIEIYGVMMNVVQYNVFVATGLIACSGIAIEDVAHFVSAFRLTQGSTQFRLATAMTHTYVAIILGSVSTFLALFPLAFHWMDFIILYQFMMFIVLVLVAGINGTCFMPAILATFGACTEKGGQVQPTEEQVKGVLPGEAGPSS